MSRVSRFIEGEQNRKLSTAKLEAENKRLREALKKAPTDNGIKELDDLCQRYNDGDINISNLVCSIWNKALMQSLNVNKD